MSDLRWVHDCVSILALSDFFQPMPSCVSPERPQKYEVITAGDYVKARFQATYNH